MKLFEHKNWFYMAQRVYGCKELETRLNDYGFRLVRARKKSGRGAYRLKNRAGKLVLGRIKPVTLIEIARYADLMMIANNDYPGIIPDQKNWPVEKEVFVRLSAAYKFGRAQGLVFPKCANYYYISNYGRLFNKNEHAFQVPEVINENPKRPNSGYYRYGANYKPGKHTNHFKASRATALFFCPNAKRKKYIHHIDLNSLHDWCWNLLFVTKEEHDELHMLYKIDQKAYYDRVMEIYKDNCGENGGPWVSLR